MANFIYVLLASGHIFVGAYSSFALAASVANDHYASKRISGRLKWQYVREGFYSGAWWCMSEYEGVTGKSTNSHYIIPEEIDSNLLQTGRDILERTVKAR